MFSQVRAHFPRSQRFLRYVRNVGATGSEPRAFESSLGAKLGAIRGGLLRTATDDYGQRTLLFRTVWTATDGYGRAASIYGSEGWGFEFLRACC